MSDERRLLIDRDRLDDELIRQPQLFYEAGEAAARAVSQREEAKDALKQVSAELYLKLRRKLSDKERPTESTINAHVESHPELVAARARYAEAQKRVEETQALKEAFAQRAYMLRELCGLHLAGYFAKNSVEGPAARGIGDAAAERNKREMAEKRARVRATR